MDTRNFDLLADRFKTLSEELTTLRIEVADAAVEVYKQGVKIVYITEALGVSTATIYNWLDSASHNGGVTLRSPGRPRKVRDASHVPNPVPNLADDYIFAWYEDKVRVDSGTKRVVIDPERIEYEGDKDLGQLLVSGTDLNLIRKFNEFVNGK